jgi:hypothetical protein
VSNQKAGEKMENALLSPGALHLFRVRIPVAERGLQRCGSTFASLKSGCHEILTSKKKSVQI